MSKSHFIDLFAGCGGLSLGLTDSGWTGLLAVERDEMAFETLCANLVDSGTRRYSWVEGVPKKALAIQDLLAKYQGQLRRLRGRVDLIAGGPPCQGFSAAGKRNGSDPRNQLLLQYVKVVSEVLPKFILIENVRGIAAKHKTSEEAYAELLLRKLHGLGYACAARIIRASECAVPQERPRYIVLGVRRGAFPTIDLDVDLLRLWDDAVSYGRKRLFSVLGTGDRKVTVKEAISDLEVSGKQLEPCADARGRFQIMYGRPRTIYQTLMHGSASSMDSMRLAKHSAETLKRFTWIRNNCHPGENVGRLELARYGNKKHTQAVLHPGKPSRTLTTLPDDLIHYSESRILTVREYARLQSFPDWFVFRGKYTTGGNRRTKECPRYTQVGNAVAPFVAQVLGHAITRLSEVLARRSIRVVRMTVRKPIALKSRRGSEQIRVWRATTS